MEIIGIVGSPHKNGMTTRLLQRALAGAEAEGANVTMLHLADEELNPCRGCGGTAGIHRLARPTPKRQNARLDCRKRTA